jgi:Uma2 family endonuclease
LHAGQAQNCGTHWCGAADFLVEVTSPGEGTREKLPFYSRLGVRELLLLDRNTWTLELHRHDGEHLQIVAQSQPNSQEFLASEVLALAFRLVPGDPRPRVEVKSTEREQTWLV